MPLETSLEGEAEQGGRKRIWTRESVGPRPQGDSHGPQRLSQSWGEIFTWGYGALTKTERGMSLGTTPNLSSIRSAGQFDTFCSIN